MEKKIAWIASRAYGIVTWREMRSADISEQEIKHRARIGVLIREYPGVYRVGHQAPSTGARYMAAVKACGEGAVLSGRAAGHLLGLLKGPPPPPEVTAPTQRSVQGIRTRRCRNLNRREIFRWRGIPITTVPRTLVDLAAVLSPPALARACHEAGVLHGTRPSHVEAVLARRPNAPGAGNLRLVMSGEEKVTLSKLERAFLSLLKSEGLPLPETNRLAGTKRVDCRWPEHRLTVELDSYRFHNSRHAWEQDRLREREARTREDEYRRYSYGDVLEEPTHMLRELRQLLRS